MEDVSLRIIRKIDSGQYKQNVKDFLLWAIREEFQKHGSRWMFKNEYNYKINLLSKKEKK